MPSLTLKMAGFEAWLSAFTSAWAQKDATAAAGLFSATASIQAGPFTQIIQGRNAVRDYWRREIVEGQLNPVIEAEPWIAWDATGICRLRGRFVSLPDYQRITLDSVLRADFRVREDEPLLCARLLSWNETLARAPGA